MAAVALSLPASTGAALAALSFPNAPAPSSLRSYIAEVDALAVLVESLDEGEDIDDEMRDQLHALMVDAITGTKDKVDRTCAVLAQYEAAAAAAAKEAERLTARKKHFDRQRARLEGYVLNTLEASGLPKIDGNTSALAIRKNPPAVEIYDATKIREIYTRTPEPPPPPAPVPDKTAIKKAIASGFTVEGAYLSNSYRLVRS